MTIDLSIASAFSEQDQQLAAIRAEQPRIVAAKIATGNGSVDESFGLDRSFRLVFVRCHFSGSSGTSPFFLSLASANGSVYDTRLFTISQAGVSKDVHFRLDESHEPSPWTFQAQDALRIEWTNPAGQTWGLEVGLAIAFEV